MENLEGKPLDEETKKDKVQKQMAFLTRLNTESVDALAQELTDKRLERYHKNKSKLDGLHPVKAAY